MKAKDEYEWSPQMSVTGCNSKRISTTVELEIHSQNKVYLFKQIFTKLVSLAAATFKFSA